MKVIIGQEIKNVCPNTRIALLRADVVNSETDEMLWTEIRQMEDRIRDSYEMAWINKRPAIAATRSLYKHFGKSVERGFVQKNCQGYGCLSDKHSRRFDKFGFDWQRLCYRRF